MQRALYWKILLVGLVALLLQVPVGMIRGLVAERQQARDGVLAEIARGTSEAQRVAGPVLVIPWLRRSTESTTTTDDAGRTRMTSKERIERGNVLLLPEVLQVEGTVDLQPKRRGIYVSQVYTLKADLRGSFRLPADLGVPAGAGKLELGHALLVLGIHDPRGIRDRIDITWQGTRPPLSPGGLEAAGLPSGIQADLGPAAPAATASIREFRIGLTLVGTQRLDIVPLGASSTISLASPWPHPSFTGRILPDAGSTVSASGFAASWRTSHFATNLAQLHQRCAQQRQCDAFNQHTIAVSFIQPVDLYLTVERSVKYGFLFILLTFAAFFLFEVLARLAIHPVQYGLVGIALSVFFLLLIALSEHLGFAPAYAIATTACVGLIGYYVGHILGRWQRGAAFALGLGSLYGLLYALLRMEDHALLLGALLVFVCLACAMIATRRVDWYAVTPGLGSATAKTA
jgi:inner membrane protein